MPKLDLSLYSHELASHDAKPCTMEKFQGAEQTKQEMDNGAVWVSGWVSGKAKRLRQRWKMQGPFQITSQRQLQREPECLELEELSPYPGTPGNLQASKWIVKGGS